jgi:hypothetical protein
MRWLQFTSLVLAASVPVFAAEDRITVGGGEFPASVAGAPWVQATNFAADGGPGGVGMSYRSPKWKADVYLFDAGDPSWVGKPLDERFVLEAVNMPGVLKELERRGIYSDVKIAGADDAKVGTLSFTHLKVSYSEKGDRKKSHYFLAKYRGRLLKIRITASEGVEDAILKRAFDDAVAPFVKNA